ncbi:MAG: DUF4241 domain-containing protein [Paracoccaceae bacterium]
MSLLSSLGLAKKPQDTGLTARDWIVKNTEAPLEVCEVGIFPTPEGQVTALDPLAFFQAAEYVATPKTDPAFVVFHDTSEGRNSKMALIYSEAHVSGGRDKGTCAVDAGMASFFTPKTHAAQTALSKKIASDGNLYHDHFEQFDNTPAGGERKIVALPDGTPVPYVHSGWGDGGYPVFTLTDTQGALCAVYVDFMGRNEEGEWLTPPGVLLT